VSDETPPEETPEVETPAAATTPDAPIVDAPAAEVPPPAEVPPAPAAETPTAEATAPDGPSVAAADPAPAAPEPVAAAVPEAAPASAAAAAPSTRKGIFVPAWAGAIVLVLVVAAAGFGIGRWTADDSSTNSTAIANNGGIVPQFPNGNGNGNPNGNGNGNSGGQTTPQTPATGTAFLGVGPQAANGGVEIASIGANSPAAKAGLQEGDVITAIDDTSITTETGLRAAIQSHDPGDSVTVHYTRDGKAATVKVTLGTQSQ